MDRKRLGVWGEKIAENYLIKKGYKILDKNYSPGFISGPQLGEIDIVACKKDLFSFIEVKTSFFNDHESQPLPESLINTFAPENRVNFQKYRKIMKVAESWLTAKKMPLDSPWQIDIISIKIRSDTKKAKIQHFQNIAF